MKNKIVTTENRRKFIVDTTKLLGLAAVGSSSLSLLTSCEKYWDSTTMMNEPVNVGLTDIKFPINPKTKRPLSGTVKAFGSRNYGIPLIIVKLSDTEYVCYSSLCTHNNCFASEDLNATKVHPPVSKVLNEIVCDCHGSRFDAYNHARVTQGPAEKPLKEFKCDFDKDTKMLTIYF